MILILQQKLVDNIYPFDYLEWTFGRQNSLISNLSGACFRPECLGSYVSIFVTRIWHILSYEFRFSCSCVNPLRCPGAFFARVKDSPTLSWATLATGMKAFLAFQIYSWTTRLCFHLEVHELLLLWKKAVSNIWLVMWMDTLTKTYHNQQTFTIDLLHN